jgi:hypothetical protein
MGKLGGWKAVSYTNRIVASLGRRPGTAGAPGGAPAFLHPMHTASCGHHSLRFLSDFLASILYLICVRTSAAFMMSPIVARLTSWREA